MPGKAAWVFLTLGHAYQILGSFSKALENHKEHQAISKEVGDRAGEGIAYGNLGRAYDSLGDFSKAIKYHGQRLAARPSSTTGSAWRLQRRWTTGRRRAGRTQTSGLRISRCQTLARRLSVTRTIWRLQRGWATGRRPHWSRLQTLQRLNVLSPEWWVT
jgi:tetratricopeptide (TPR) repeat protein